MERKLAVIFPGIGYHKDKPLLYYSRKLVIEYGYEVICADYGKLPSKIKGDKKKMYDACETALKHAEDRIKEIDFESYDKILFISKSIGTAVAALFDEKNHIGAEHIYFTPVEESFQAIGTKGIVFHGTKDSWARTSVIRTECEKRKLMLCLTDDADHSMETGDALKDLEIMRHIMEETKRYIESFQRSMI